IVQFIGDAIMAIFNAPVRQPDHPVRAARAALAFQARTRELAADHADWPLFRVGIATGPAVVGNVGSDEVRSYSAIGDTVNLAARLQTSAQVGQVVVSPATAAALGGSATLRPIGALSLKGKSAPVEAYERDAIWAIKELLEPMSEADARADVAFQIAALRAGLPLPEPVLRSDGGVLAGIAPDGGRPVTVRVYRWVELADPVVAAPADSAAG